MCSKYMQEHGASIVVGSGIYVFAMDDVRYSHEVETLDQAKWIQERGGLQTGQQQ